MNNLDQPLRERKRNTLKAPQRDPLPEPTKPARREALGITCRPLPVLSLTVCSSSTAGRGITGTTNGISGKAFLTALAASLAMATSLGVDGASAALPALPSGCEPNAERTSVICVGEPGAIATAKRMNGCWSLEDGSTLCVDPPEPSKPEACDYAAGECGVVIDPDRDRCVIPGRTSPLEFIVSGKVLSVDWPWGNDGADDSKLVASQQALATALESGDYAYLTATCDPEGQGLIDPRRGDQTTASEAQPIPGASADDSSRGDTAGSPDGATADPSTIGGEAPAFSDSSILPAACELAECDFTVDPNAEDQCFMPGIDSDQPRASFVISGDRVLAVNVPWGQDPGFDSAVYNNTRRTVFAAVSGNWEDIFSRCDANLVASAGRALGVHAWLTRDELDRMAPFLNYPGLPANSIPGESPTTKPDGSVPTLRAESAGSGKSGDRAATSRKASGQSGRAKTGSKAQTGRQGRSGKRKGVRRGAPTRVINSKRTSGHSKLKSGKRR